MFNSKFTTNLLLSLPFLQSVKIRHSRRQEFDVFLFGTPCTTGSDSANTLISLWLKPIAAILFEAVVPVV